ncbi:putative cytochrome P450 [Dendryphion nanum]|uniref:Cytochrome P450 n=1 Tax=Dendryphion nanum TaxID=256645 RepID=A0A9P9IJ45_9PLEO|nr:putative cytochrome P450 [Dendryphion nanum]
MIVALAIVSLLLLGTWACWKFGVPFFLPPAHFPRNIPTVPFYYALLPLLKPVDQEQLWHQHLKEPLMKHGAVKIYFAGAWNVILTRPSYIGQVLKQDEKFPKAGNHVRNPHGLLAFYTGENVISEKGEKWKKFASVIKPGLQADVDHIPIVQNTDKLIHLILDEQKRNGRVIMPSLLQQYTLENLGRALLGVDFNCLGNSEEPMTKSQSVIKPKIFDAVFMNFPILDKFKFAHREDAKEMIIKFKSQLVNYVLSAHQHKHEQGMEATNLGCRLVTAYETGIFSRYHFTQNCVSVFLAGHENPQILLLFIMYMLAEKPELQQQLRDEINQLPENDRQDPAVLAALPLLTATIYEVLRLYPPISQMINKRAAHDTLIDGKILIKAGTNTGYHGYTTNRDESFWGPDAAEFRPTRWGTTADEVHTLFRRATAKATFISFHGGARTCLGVKFTMMATRLGMAMFLSNLEWKLDPTWPKRMTPAGPLIPLGLRLQFSRIATKPE